MNLLKLFGPGKLCLTRVSEKLVTTVVLAALLGLFCSERALACATCGCTLSKDWLGPQAGSVSGWSVGISYDVIDQNQMRAGTHNVDLADAQTILNPTGISSGNEVELQTLTRLTTFNIDYNSADWGVTVQLPFVYRYHTTLSDGTEAGYSFNQFDALGDARVVAKISLTEDSGSGLIVGMQLPTGGTNELFSGGSAAGTPVDPSLQPGTGATQILLGGFYSGAADKLAWFAQGFWQHALASQSGYTPGDAMIVNGGLLYSQMGQAVVPLLQINFVHRNADRGNLVNVQYNGTPLTGGNLVYLAPGVSARLGGGFSAFAYVQVPVFQNVRGVQLTPKEIFSFGVRKSF
jgi:hypothetical protein